MGNCCLVFGWSGGPCQVTCPTNKGMGVGVGVKVGVKVGVEVIACVGEDVGVEVAGTAQGWASKVISRPACKETALQENWAYCEPLPNCAPTVPLAPSPYAEL